MRLSWLIFTAVIGASAAEYCDPIPIWDPFPNCQQCKTVLDQMRFGAESIVNGIVSGAYIICQLNRATEEQCVLTKDAFEETAFKTIEILLPKKFNRTANRQFSCSRLVPICPDKAPGAELPAHEWSCEGCTQFMKLILQVIKTPISKINTNAAAFFLQGKRSGLY